MGILEATNLVNRLEGIEEGIEVGIEKGELRKTEQFIINLIQQTDFSNEQIADLAGTDTIFVTAVRERL